MNQVEYNKFYDGIKRYANSYASGLFSDRGLRDEAIDKAMDRLTDELLNFPWVDNLVAFAKVIVINSLKCSARDRIIDVAPSNVASNLINGDMRIRQIVNRGKYPKVRLLQIENPGEKQICLLYWQYGYKQGEIAKKLEVTKQYISSVIKKYSK